MILLVKTLLLSLAFVTPLIADIKYTDIEPDSLVFASFEEQIKSFYVDIDGDGSYDYEIRHFNPDADNSAVEIHPNHTTLHEVEICLDSDGYPEAIMEGITLSEANKRWGKNQFGVFNSIWYNNLDRFIGFRIRLTSGWHYGWIRVRILSEGRGFIIKDFAYNTVASESVTTGTVSGNTHTEMDNTQQFEANIYPHPCKGFVSISLNNNKLPSVIVFKNFSGTELFRIDSNDENTLVSLENFPSGMYVLEFLTNSNVVSRRAIVIHK